jgi:hypothetical protein
MKRLLLLLLLPFCCFAQTVTLPGPGPVKSSGGGLTITKVQSCNSHNISTTITVTFSAASPCVGAPTAGNLLVYEVVEIVGSSGSLSSISAGETWVQNPGSCAGTSGSVAVQTMCGYVLSAAGGESSLTFTFSASQRWFVTITEWHTSSGAWHFDAANNLINSSASTTPSFPSLSITGPNEVIIEFIGIGASVTVTSLSSPYNSATFSWSSGGGTASDSSAITTSSTGNWTLSSSGASVVSAIAFFAS